MKAIVENMPIFESSEEISFFAGLLNRITLVQDQEMLRKAVKKYFEYLELSENYDYGFGSNHMWVKKNSSPDRLILVEF